MVPKEEFVQSGVKQVLIVDNNNELLESLKAGLDKYSQLFTTVLANDGEQALAVLKEKPISVVVSDVKMPKMNGLALLSNMTNQFPDIPVIIISAYGQDELEWLSRKSGAVAFVSKPFSVDDIGKKILSLLQKESDGGIIKGISVGVFMQLAEMEEMTCTIRVFSEDNHTQGVVFFKRGKLLDARYSDDTGEKALVQILLLEQAHLRIQNSCPDLIESKINTGLQAMLLEAMRQKDEGVEDGAVDVMEPPEAPIADAIPTQVQAPAAASQTLSPPSMAAKLGSDGQNADLILKRIVNEIGKGFGWQRIESDPGWEHTVSLSIKAGDLFNADGFKCGYIRKKDDRSNLFLPGSPSAVLKVNHTCPRDRIFRVVSRIT